MKILLVEDDEHVAEIVTLSLRQQHYVVEVANDGLIGLDLALSILPDLIILDVELPKLDGISLCKQLRQQKLQTPILLLTARSTGDDKIMGLDAGADDYVVKPCNLTELSAHIRALLRRGGTAQTTILEWGGLQLDPATCEITYEGTPVSLRPKEYSLLELFLRNGRRVFSRTAILDQLWTLDDSPNEDTVKAHIKGLRQHLKAAGAPPELIDSVYGLGYRLNPELEKSSSLAGADPEVASIEAKQQAVSALMEAWPRFKPKMLERIQHLSQAVSLWEQNPQDESPRLLAAQLAHKLAGSLGTLGFARGTDLSRQLEHRLQSPLGLSASLIPLVAALEQELQQDPQHGLPLGSLPQPDPLRSIATPLRLRVIGSDRATVQALAQDSALARVQVEHGVGSDWLGSVVPDLVLIDLATQAEQKQVANLLKTQTPAIPFLLAVSEDTLATRVATARLGGRGVVPRPLRAEQVVLAMRSLQLLTDPGQIKVLVLDDDQEFLQILQELLQPWGFVLAPVSDPQTFWTRLQTDPPDLLILDVDMPEFSGLDLCQVIRSDTRFDQLPILFLTACRDAETITRMFSVGADDYVNKPIIGPELIARILNRIDRTHRRKGS